MVEPLGDLAPDLVPPVGENCLWWRGPRAGYAAGVLIRSPDATGTLGEGLERRKVSGDNSPAGGPRTGRPLVGFGTRRQRVRPGAAYLARGDDLSRGGRRRRRRRSSPPPTPPWPRWRRPSPRSTPPSCSTCRGPSASTSSPPTPDGPRCTPSCPCPRPRWAGCGCAAGSPSPWPGTPWPPPWVGPSGAGASRSTTTSGPLTTPRPASPPITWWPCSARWRRVAASAGLGLDAFMALAAAALQDVADLGPAAALTGPAARGDEATLARHRGRPRPRRGPRLRRRRGPGPTAGGAGRSTVRRGDGAASARRWPRARDHHGPGLLRRARGRARRRAAGGARPHHGRAARRPPLPGDARGGRMRRRGRDRLREPAAVQRGRGPGHLPARPRG